MTIINNSSCWPFQHLVRNSWNQADSLDQREQHSLHIQDSTSIPPTSSVMQSEKSWAVIKVIQYRDLDYETAKKEVACYFRMKGEAYASDASTHLELDYDLVCRIMDDLEKEGKMEAVR